ncbi:DNA repair protein RadC [Nonlabens dokdonensis]|jgi:DNA repair protein RadC|uniref:DNA repair protein n=2 Tax=Nonlabens dokdonensis TaxID=328515 RepID=L7W6C5_NONDD|nr:DNA repair protein RadC [Nonlabens dokdonensis]AGC75684.1 DNA repair protein [Nonlabens dokdonensis DSW-6]PZX43372.1 DNA repair protein RadC [Nonlabens dokdonensis]
MDEDHAHFSIKEWSLNDRPREKLLHKGSSSLSEAELIAILIGSGTRKMSAVDLSRIIVNDAGNSLDTLGKKSLKDLMKYKGIGEAKAITIAAALELGKRRAMEMPVELPKITSSNDAFRIMQPILGELPHEEFWVMLLDNSHKVLEKKNISIGGITGTLVDTRLVFKKAIEAGAVAMVLSHNHPSGNLKPSMQDKALTIKLVEAGKLLDIKVLDHLIITQQGFYSFADEGLI